MKEVWVYTKFQFHLVRLKVHRGVEQLVSLLLISIPFSTIKSIRTRFT